MRKKLDPETLRLIEIVGRENNFWAVVRWTLVGAVVIWWILA
jgi:hypothetical protein